MIGATEPPATVAVIGAGRMGSAIAFVFAAAGFPVALHDANGSALDRAADELARVAALRDHPPVDVRRCTALADAVANADLVIEAVAELPAVKRQVLSAAAEAAAQDAILATNTSSIPIRDLAGAVPDPSRLVGAHFWNPPYAISLVEVVQAADTSDEVVEATMAILRRAAMVPVHIRRDVPGFVGNRLQHALKREAIALVAAGVCDAETIDTVTKLGFGRRMEVLGPLEQSDLVGLELTLSIHEQVIPDLDVTQTPHPYLVEKVRAGELGMKTGRGFRDWTPEQARAVQERLDAHLLHGQD